MMIFRDSITGKRETNQDYTCLSYNQANHIMVVLCDGMGGHQAGDTASRMTAEFLCDKWETSSLSTKEDVISWAEDSINQVNEAIYEKGLENQQMFGMGSTVVLCAILDEDIVVANVGDSRAYQYSSDQLSMITDDHSFAYELYLKGEITKEEAAAHRQRNMLTRSVGLPDKISVDVFELKPRQISKIILCSDGLSDTLTNENMKDIIDTENSLDDVGNKMIEAAYQNGSTDNITLVLIDLENPERGGS